MGKRSSPTWAEFRALMRLLQECRDLGDDPVAWRRHFYRGLAGLVGADATLGGEAGLALGEDPRMTDLGTEARGWPGCLRPQGWERCLEELRENPGYSPLLNEFLRRVAADGPQRPLTRNDLIRDPDWYRSDYYADFHEPLGVNHSLLCFVPIGNAPGVYSSLALFREPGRSDFSPLEKALVLEAHGQVARLIDGPLARFRTPSPADCGPRSGAVLGLLLRGYSDKQIARELRMSVHSVHGHTKGLYERFGVGCRAELLAIWVRRRWDGPCPWDDPDRREG